MGDNLTPAVSSWSEILGSSVRPFLIELQHLLLLAVLLIFLLVFILLVLVCWLFDFVRSSVLWLVIMCGPLATCFAS